MRVRPTWDEYFMLQAKMAALRSTCNSRPTGCVLVKNNSVVATGYNGSVRGMPHCQDLATPGYARYYCHRRAREIVDGQKDRFCLAVHAEANAIAQAARQGVSVDGAVAYCTLYPCLVCMKLFYQAGIVKVYYELPYDDEPDDLLPTEELILSDDTLRLAGASVVLFSSHRRLEKTE